MAAPIGDILAGVFGGMANPQQGYYIGKDIAERRERNRALMETTGTSNISSAYAQEMIRKRTQEDANILMHVYQIDPQKAIQAWNAHPMLSQLTGQLTYHPDYKFVSDSYGGVISIGTDEKGKPTYSRNQVVSPALMQKMKDGDKTTITWEQDGVKYTGNARGLGMDINNDGVVTIDEINQSVTGAGVEGRPNVSKLSKEQDALLKAKNDIIGGSKTTTYSGLSDEDKVRVDKIDARLKTIQARLTETGAGTGEKVAPPNQALIDQAYEAIDKEGDVEGVRKKFLSMSGYELPPRADASERNF